MHYLPDYCEPKLVDILPMYRDARVRITWEDGTISEMTEYNVFSGSYIFGTDLLTKEGENPDVEIELTEFKGKFQLMLHHPCEMSAIQKKTYDSLLHTNDFKEGNVKWHSDTPASIFYLFKNHIDGFNLIERGLAIKIEKT